MATASWGLINRGLGSVVLSWATAAAVVALALGIGATTPVPAPVALVVAAIATEVRTRHGAAVTWATIAGVGPVATLCTHALAPVGEPDSLLARLEGTAHGSRLVALILGVASAAVLACNASRREDPGLALLAVCALAVGVANGWLTLEPDGGTNAAGLARHTAPTRGERPPSSWIAYVPALVLIGAPALAERVAGGAGTHALLAGTVGLAGVAVGGARRLAGPLISGTVLLVCLAGYETIAVTAGVPTWAWLATGGSVLLGAGIAMERADTGPLETGRRLVDIVGERFGRVGQPVVRPLAAAGSSASQ